MSAGAAALTSLRVRLGALIALAVAPLLAYAFYEIYGQLGRAEAGVQVDVWRWFGLLLATLLAAVLIGIVLTREVLKPVAALREGARRLAAGELTHRVAHMKSGDLDGLAQDFNEMAARLEESRRRLTASVSARVVAEEALRRAKERLERALEASNLALWDTNLATGEVFLSEGWAQLLGNSPGETRTTVETLMTITHPDDLTRAVQLSLETMKGLRPEYSVEHRVRTSSGEWKWVLSRGKVTERDAEGRAVRMSGTNLDITERKRAEEALRESEARFRALTELSSDWFWEQDEHGHLTVASQDFLARMNASSLGQRGLRRWEVPGLEPVDGDWEKHKADIAARRPFRDLKLKRRSSSGATRYFISSGEPMYDAEGRFRGYRGVGHDITAEVTASELLRESEQRFRDVVDAAGEYVWETNAEFRYTFVSSRVTDVLGYAPGELIGRVPADMMPPGELERIKAWLAENAGPDKTFRGLEHRALTKDGRMIWLCITGIPIFDRGGRFVGYRGAGLDITERKETAARIEILATRDPLTELPNRVLLADRCSHAISSAKRDGRRLGLLFLDLDRFKHVNDSLGHHVGDELLRSLAGRITQSVRKGDTVARIGGDEFVVLLDGINTPQDAVNVAQKIVATVAVPIAVGHHHLAISTSLGISLYPEDGEDFATLLKHADIAMYHAKERGRNNFQFFSAELNARAVERAQLEADLRLAIARSEMELHYQPIVDGRSGKMVGAEALMRWRRADGSLAPAEVFLQLAVETGLIGPLGEWALEVALSQLQEWRARGRRLERLAVNVSPQQLARGARFAERVIEMIDRHQLEPGVLELELTEGALTKNTSDTESALDRLVAAGVRIAVADFGAGNSSLWYLKRLPIGTLKIGRGFVRDIERDQDDAAIVGTVVAMARNLGLDVTAEGVETRGQLDRLASLGCDRYQGHYFSGALAATEFEERFLCTAAAEESRPAGKTPHRSLEALDGRRIHAAAEDLADDPDRLAIGP
jgi:diguanylate cyclase (GGDEF)-like protein/PAS domain S-box-containing protein